MNNILTPNKDELLDEMLKKMSPDELLAQLINVLTPVELRYYFCKINKSLQSDKDASKIHLL